MKTGKSNDTILLTHDTVRPHMLQNNSSVSVNKLDIHPERKARANWVGHHQHIEELARHVLRNTQNADKLIDQIFSQKIRYASPLINKNYDTKLGIPWL